MKKLINGGVVDCAECAFGYHGDGSCGEGCGVKEKGLQGCNRGRAMRVTRTPLQEYKQMMMARLQPGAAGRRA